MRGRPAPTRRPHRTIAAIVVASFAVVAAACSSSPSANSGATGSTTTTAAARSTTSSTAASSTTTSSATAAAANCQSSGLSFTVGQGNGAAGTIEEPVTMTNTSGAACTLFGYPGLQLYDSSGTAIPTNVVRGGVTFGTTAANAAAAKVTLAPMGTAQFTLHYSDVPVGNETTCPTSSTAHITPPNDLTSATVALAIAPCGGGTVHVSPVYAG